MVVKKLYWFPLMGTTLLWPEPSVVSGVTIEELPSSSSEEEPPAPLTLPLRLPIEQINRENAIDQGSLQDALGLCFSVEFHCRTLLCLCSLSFSSASPGPTFSIQLRG